jgi:hypothetical protein
MTRVVLHVGPPKTGSTAIQSFLFEQRPKLKRLGILYPRSGLKNQDEFGARHKRLTHNPPRKAEHWSRAIEEIKGSNCDMAIISCEGFWQHEDHIPEIAARLSPFDVTVIAVLRRQDRLLASRFTHLVRHENYTETPEALWAESRTLMDFNARLRLWAEWLPTRPILYPENKHGLIARFLAAVDAGPPAIELASYLQPLYANRNVSSTASDPDRILGPELAKAVLEESRDSNKALFADFFSVQDYSEALWT